MIVEFNMSDKKRKTKIESKTKKIQGVKKWLNHT
jgi:hypothetical protein